MIYQSTRSAALTADSARAVLEGMAPDGGLYLPRQLPTLDVPAVLAGGTLSMAVAILSALLPDIPDMPALVRRAYTGKFETDRKSTRLNSSH